MRKYLLQLVRAIFTSTLAFTRFGSLADAPIPQAPLYRPILQFSSIVLQDYAHEAVASNGNESKF